MNSIGFRSLSNRWKPALLYSLTCALYRFFTFGLLLSHLNSSLLNLAHRYFNHFISIELSIKHSHLTYRLFYHFLRCVFDIIRIALMRTKSDTTPQAPLQSQCRDHVGADALARDDA